MKVPSDIILGPPKTAFASASTIRNIPKSLDTPGRPNLTSYISNSSKNENQLSRDKSNDDKDKRDGEEDTTKVPTLGVMHGRRNGREDGDTWEGLRSGKSFGTDDSQRTFRKNGERDNDQDKVDGRNNRRPQQKGFESHRRGDDNTTNQRNGIGRGNRASWYRDSDPQSSQGLDGGRENTKGRDWRDGERSNRRGVDREWNRSTRAEQDPEWMMEPEAEDNRKTHTVEDMEKWKASMKASTTAEPSLTEPADSRSRSASEALPNVGNRKLGTPLILDPSVDKFFGMWSLPKSGDRAAAGEDGEEKSKPDTTRPNPPKSSRFTGFFGSKPEKTPSQPEPQSFSVPPEKEKDSSSEDKEGFQRILQMLGSGNPVVDNASPMFFAQPTKPARVEQGPSGGADHIISPREHVKENERASPPIHSPRSRRSIGLESLLGPQSPREGPGPQNRDSEFLLKLMQHKGSDSNQLVGGSHRPPTGNTPGILPYPNMPQPQQHSNHLYRTETYGEATNGNGRPRDKLNPTANQNRRIQMPPNTEFYDDIVTNPVRRQSVPTVSQQYGLSSGLQRPPGFEPLPPGYSQHMQQQQQQQRQSMVVPPPGFQNPNRNANQFPPGLIPNLSNLNVSNDRSLQFGMRQMGPGPGAPPPPGFVGINGPPPGFPPMVIPQDGRISPSNRMFFSGGPQRHPMDAFGDPAQFGLAGRGALPGQYRRQE